MQLQTHIPFNPQPHNQIDYHSKVLMFGSCFTENIGKKLDYFKFQKASNPFGILFHPKAIENLILNAINEKVYFDDELFHNNERWHNFEAHSSLSNLSKEDVLTSLNNGVKLTKQRLTDSTHIIITLGTAWIYRFIETQIVVANCHKIPQKKFSKEILSVSEIVESLSSIISLVKNVNKNVSLIFTVSPVRHLKEGFTENALSKAHLITAVQQVIAPENKTYYFPSYEIMMDELRDYRFYAEDMLHPSRTAIDYIWGKFSIVWISKSAESMMAEIDNIQKGLLHKPLNPDSEQHREFLKYLDKKTGELRSNHPHIKFNF